MRCLLLGLLVLGSSLAIGCNCDCNHRPTSFFWDTRLVPTDGHEPVVSATGHTEHVVVEPMPEPAPAQ